MKAGDLVGYYGESSCDLAVLGLALAKSTDDTFPYLCLFARKYVRAGRIYVGGNASKSWKVISSASPKQTKPKKK